MIITSQHPWIKIVFISALVLALIGGMLSGYGTVFGASPSLQKTPPPELPRREVPDSSLNQVPRVVSSVIPATATELAMAMGVPSEDLIAADLMGSDPDGVGISDAPLGNFFPNQGNTFAILSSGLAASSSLPNDSSSLSTFLDDLNNDQGNDMVRLHLRLQVPPGINCLSFDFVFYSEEFPEFVGSAFNDTFTAQLNNSSITTEANQVIAPDNFAFDTEDNIISVNTVFGVSGDTNTTYDGSTPQLRAVTQVTPNTQIDVYLSIQDLGDSIYDSTVFLDRFFWSVDETCAGGAAVDTDGDGLLDDWEENGLTVGGEFVDLPAMGSDPNHKDIFVEIDWMGTPTGLDSLEGSHDHAPDPNAIQTIVDAFENAPVNNPDGTTGIHLHVDYGANAPLTWGTASTWGTLSESDELTHDDNLGTSDSSDNYVWSEFDSLKNANFSDARMAVFHYNIWAHNLAPSFGGTSGISRNGSGTSFGEGASDFIVSLGSWPGQTGTENQQAGTFMHELGHNLGLRHGGPDHTQWKPNYLSVMNYAFQTRGLLLDGSQGNFDYSRYDLPDLDENSLDEPDGINVPSSTATTLGTIYYCGLNNAKVDFDASQVDWNCDGDASDMNVSANVNQGVSWNNNAIKGTLTSHNDWDNLVFTGGAIAAPGADIDLPSVSPVIDIDEEQNDDIPLTTANVDLWVKSSSVVATQPAVNTVVPVQFSNYGLSVASNVVLTMTLSNNVVYLSDTSGISPTLSGNTVVWNIGDLGLTEGSNFGVEVSVPDDPLGTRYPISFSITSEGPNPEFDADDNETSLEIFLGDPLFLPLITR